MGSRASGRRRFRQSTTSSCHPCVAQHVSPADAVPAPLTFALGVTPVHQAERYMSKSTTTYWNALIPENRERWTSIKGMEGMAEELTLSVDDVTGEYTRLTRFLPGANTCLLYTSRCV